MDYRSIIWIQKAIALWDWDHMDNSGSLVTGVCTKEWLQSIYTEQFKNGHKIILFMFKKYILFREFCSTRRQQLFQGGLSYSHLPAELSKILGRQSYSSQVDRFCQNGSWEKSKKRYYAYLFIYLSQSWNWEKVKTQLKL